jgi:hypothetical protein
MYGASLKPESSYSPISSIPSASRGAPSPFAGRTCVCSVSDGIVVMAGSQVDE